MGGKSQSHLPSPFTISTWLDLTTFVGRAATPASNRGALTPDVDLDIFMSTFALRHTSAPVLNSYHTQQTGTRFPASHSSVAPGYLQNRNHG
jgi:hypothetical protein